MEKINFKISDNKAIIEPCGKVDSSNAAEVEGKITNFLKSETYNGIIFDFENLEYISSAGLRVLLRILKAEKNVSVINVSPEVYEILDVTGFAELMDVKKAYRKISIDNCAVIGTGATGTVYRLDDEIIVKVYNDENALSDIHRERELARQAFVLGLPTAIPFDVVKVGEKYGSVFELLRAESLAEVLIKNPSRVDDFINLTVDLMKNIHSTEVNKSDLPPFKLKAEKLADFMEKHLPCEKAQKFKKLVEEIPDKPNMLHCDLHIKNIMLQNGEVFLIDMDTLSYGHPVFEFAALFNAYLGYSELDKNNTLEFFGIEYETGVKLWKGILNGYFAGNDTEYIRSAENKAKLLGYGFLFEDFYCENPDEENKKRLDVYKNHILSLLDDVDSLVF